MKANRLLGEKSPYLLQHAYNPVDWYPWGEEAFARARELDRPIFLSVGYSTCHWCHVMERESFEDPAIAEVMNRLYVNVKLDREERPDIDRVYMSYVQASTGSGGWPMSVWLTPELKPIYGGTYYPPDDRYGRPGFRSVLERIAEVWREQREAVVLSSENILAQLRAASAASPRQMLDSALLFRAFKILQQSYDPRHGGFGGAPKFPRPVVFNFLLRYFARSGDAVAWRMVSETLFRMASGGMYDQLGGGFHRYSVDAWWHVPHFEKMLYDQAQLVISLVETHQITGKPFFARIARETIDYVLRDLTHPEGGFFSAEDADSPLEHGKPERAEGAFYVWTHDEIADLLVGDAAAFNAYYGVKPEGNADDPHGELTGKNVLHVMQPDEDPALDRARSILLEARGKRPRPHLDDKILCAWNGLMISALARAAAALAAPHYLDAAQRAARFVTAHLWREDSATLARRFREGHVAFEATLEDYAFFAQGLIDLYEASFESEWLRLARRLTERMIELFWDDASGGFFTTSGRDASVLLRMKDDYDGAEPSGNSIATLNLLRLSEMLEVPEWRTLAERTLQAFSGGLAEHPHAMPQMLVAYSFFESAPTQVVIAGDKADPVTREMLRTVHQRFLPNRVLLSRGDAAWLAGTPPERATAYVCRHFACELPVENAADLRALLAK